MSNFEKPLQRSTPTSERERERSLSESPRGKIPRKKFSERGAVATDSAQNATNLQQITIPTKKLQ